MSSLTVYAPQITILDNVVNVVDGLYSLNDLHKASGKEKKHQPFNFMRNQEVTDLIEELQCSSDMRNKQVFIKLVSGKNRGTYVCKELVYRYAMWISPKFALLVIRTFDKLVTGEVKVQSTQLTSEQTLPLRNAVNKLVSRSGIMYPEGYKIVHQQFGVNHIKELTLEQLSQAIEYIHEYIHNHILSLNVETTPISSFTHNQYIMNVKSEIIEYVHLLQRIVVAGGNTLPKYPEFDKEEICQAFLVSVIKNNRMMVSFNFEGKTEMSFVPEEHAVVSRESLSSVIRFADKSQLPSIINEAVKRLGS